METELFSKTGGSPAGVAEEGRKSVTDFGKSTADEN